MSYVNLALSIIGVVGITTIVNGLLWSRRLTVTYRFLRLTPREPLDVVLVTSGLEEGGVAGIPYRRPVTSFGTMQGAAMFAKAIGDLKARKHMSVSVSEQLVDRPRGDLIMLGDPSKNPVAQRFVEDFNASFPDLTLDRRQIAPRTRLLKIGEFEVRYELRFQPTSDNPLTDIGVVVAWLNPFTYQKRRAVFCAGFTGWGTAAATQYYLDDLLRSRYRELRRRRQLPRLFSPAWPCFVCVVEVSLSGGTLLGLNELFFQKLPDQLPVELLRGRTRNVSGDDPGGTP